ncbi:unnamed protein product [Penicillium nalgiovense]|uniref:GAR domain-containing protein n=1 Tax=Penicillium nalgiovense TaxID=60175 RepID=A0A1V6Z0G1_PENNA|nr:hypothetical protein PENNAL_c0006G08961 [Penicillium nalgiovense]CAG7978516.1 unnamed protein product [Penicillium nalgiovense]CAG8002578.1 unnamed protein product [Penicillium nalgiovense]CAG8002924.1 unnamed protein product [Penicillium nalgiovense]CAG8090066.1 unnamed protein product [Penicillium nalgiovense]
MAASKISPSRPSIRLSPVQSHSRNNSRSTSVERIPGSIYQQLDPLLSNLSPESTLQALTSTDAVPSDEQAAHDILSQSISQVSPSERALGIRAAVAAQNLNLWHKEVQSWVWPNQRDAKVGMGFIPPHESHSGGNPTQSGLLAPPSNTRESYYGSLLASVVERYEKRADEIRDGMDDLNVEELKEHVLNAHIPSRSRPSSATSCASVPPPLSYVQLSDFTAVITATILRALPHLSRLNALLATWEVRIFVLRQIPGLLRELSLTRSALDSSLHALRSPHSSAFGPNGCSDASLAANHVKLESAVVAVGRRMDRVLDALEGRPDSLPEQWIDDLEAIESDFAAWVVEADKYKVHSAWLRSKAEAQMAEMRAPDCQRAESLKETRQDPTSDPVGSELSDDLCSPQEHAAEHEPELQCDLVLSPGDAKPISPESVEELTVPVQETPLPADCVKGDASPNSRLLISSLSKSPIAEKQEDLTPVVVAEDLDTPTQSDFPPDPATSRQPFSTPAHTPCASDRTSENKENIPPLGFQQLDRAVSPPGQASTRASPLSEHSALAADPCVQHSTAPEMEVKRAEVVVSVGVPAGEELTASASHKDLLGDTVVDEKGRNSDEEGKHSAPHSQSTELNPEPETINPPVGQDPKPLNGPSGQSQFETPVAAISPMLTPNRSEIRVPKSRPSGWVSQIPMAVASPKSGSNPTAMKSYYPSNDGIAESCQQTVRKPLQSPIKLSKFRPGKPDLDKDGQVVHKITHRRRTSTGSVGSLLSDHSSLISSPEAPEPRTASSNVTPLRPSSRSESTHAPPHGDYTLREDRLRRLENQKPDPRISFQQSRTVSLPLERFINERLELGLGSESAPGVASVKPSRTRTHSVTSGDFPKPPKTRSKITSQDASAASVAPVPRLPTHRHQLSRGKSTTDLNSQHEMAGIAEQNKKTFGMNSARRAMEHLLQPKSLRWRQRLTAHPSLESLGVKRQELSYVEEHGSEPTDFGFRASSPAKQSKQPRDQLDEKVNSILNSLPGHIHMVDSNHEADTSSSSSSLDRRMRYRSESPTGPARSNTPAHSLTLMPAARRRHSHAYKTEDSCVKLYHLHHGGQSAPTKLFVRTVGEEGQRVMVRVGGGWADLGEYLREYVIHHGRRKVSETPRVEVQGIKTRSSPSYASPGTMLSPATPYLASGRATPSRPPSVLSARPPSSLNVHKKRRGSTASDAMGTRAVTTGHISSFTSPPPTAAPLPSSAGRRLSVSSGYSVGDAHSPGNTATAPIANDSRSTPLGLAGPKPRARYESMSPEGEAWVADVLQKTRRSSSLNPPQFAPSMPPGHDADDRFEIGDSSVVGHSLPKVRSIGDIGSIGTSKRVVLKGLGSRRP